MTTKRLTSSLTPKQHTLDVLIPLLETEYPDKDLNDLNTLRRLLLEEFELSITHNEIVNYLLMCYDEEDNKLQYKHLNIRV